MNERMRKTLTGGARAARITWRVLRMTWRFLGHLAGWVRRNGPWVVLCLVVAGLAWTSQTITPAQEDETARAVAYVAVAVGLAPGVLVSVWRLVTGRTGPRITSRGPGFLVARQVTSRWPGIAAECGLARKNDTPAGSALTAPPLVKVWVADGVVTLRIRALVGQTLDTLETAVPKIATAYGALGHMAKPAGPTDLDLGLVLADHLAGDGLATMPELVTTAVVRMGRRQGGAVWDLQVMGRHTLVVGCSGSGKGSMFWGVAGGLAPAVARGVVWLWGIDLKRGVEAKIGDRLFCTVADNRAEALVVLRRLLEVIDTRGRSMAGKIRQHTPTPSEPLHVLLIDELAALTAYGDNDTKAEASRLLSEILTQGRALGVVVVACVQDPRKETVPARGLFTQTIALRLRSGDEVRMVLGDGMSHVAPAHRINPTHPGTAFVVNDDGTTDKVRADYWTDDLIRATAGRYPSPVRFTPEAPASPATPALATAPAAEAPGLAVVPDGETPARTRKPRAPRKPRTPRPAAAQVSAPSQDGAA